MRGRPFVRASGNIGGALVSCIVRRGAAHALRRQRARRLGWERLGDALPISRLDVVIEGTGDDPRRIALRSADPGYARYLEAAA